VKLELFGNLTIELLVGFFALLFSTKVLKNRQLSQITPFDFISALVLGEFVGNAIYDKEVTTDYILYAVFLWTLLLYIVEKITQNYKSTRNFFEGSPMILIRGGKIDYKELKRSMLDINELQQLLREKQVFSVRQVEYAVLERNGSVSVLKKSQYENPTLSDLKLVAKPVYLPTTLVIDGEILWNNLKAIGYEEKWLSEQLKKNGAKHLRDVFYAEWQEEEGLHLSFKY